MDKIVIETPITKEQLQKGYIIKNKIIEDIKKKSINEVIEKTINEIILLIISNTIDESIHKEVKKTEQEINKIKRMQKLKYKFDNIFGKSLSIELYTIFNKYITQYPTKFNMKYIPITEKELNIVKKQIYEQLKEKLPDCKIEMDSFKSFILIDWN
jgi:hypothetical protein